MSKNVFKLVGDAKTIAVICNQWGDTGKGKIIDFLGNWADIVIRYRGADNCGHTIVIGDKKYVTHMLPSSIIHDSAGKISVIARGVAFNPLSARQEFEKFEKDGITRNHLKISRDAHLILPWHIAIDMLREKHANGKIGTTGRGVGPVFSDHVARYGLKVVDMLNPKILREKLTRNLQDKMSFLRDFDENSLKDIFYQKILENGRFYCPENIINIEAVNDRYIEHGKFFRQNICDAEKFIRESIGRYNILLEGAQGALLDIDHGVYPYVTSSNVTASSLFKSCDIQDHEVDLVFSTVKAPYITKVGEGSMPTEIGGYNAVVKFKDQYDVSAISLLSQLNSIDGIIQGGAIGKIGNEFGATTGRPRRTGWLDLPALKYAVCLTNVKQRLVITKPDVLTGCKTIKVCISYTYHGPSYDLGDKVINYGDRIGFIPKDEILKYCRPVYMEFNGWTKDISNAKSWSDLPIELRDILNFVSERVGVKIGMVSVGPDRSQTILVDK